MSALSGSPGTGGGWFAVRLFFRWKDIGAYEERITLWQARDFDEAIRKAEEEGDQYEETSEPKSVRIDRAQAFQIAGPIGEGAEVFSLLRNSELDPENYVDEFFATGAERQTQWTNEGSG